MGTVGAFFCRPSRFAFFATAVRNCWAAVRNVPGQRRSCHALCLYTKSLFTGLRRSMGGRASRRAAARQEPRPPAPRKCELRYRRSALHHPLQKSCRLLACAAPRGLKSAALRVLLLTLIQECSARSTEYHLVPFQITSGVSREGEAPAEPRLAGRLALPKRRTFSEIALE